jgi:hypothetical protein
MIKKIHLLVILIFVSFISVIMVFFMRGNAGSVIEITEKIQDLESTSHSLDTDLLKSEIAKSELANAKSFDVASIKQAVEKLEIVAESNDLSKTNDASKTEVLDVTQDIVLLSSNRPVKSDVRGNLGPAQVITSETMNDWFADRWQAAKDMSGRPILGEHWVEIDLQRNCIINSFIIDWEDGYSDSWVIEGRKFEDDDGFILAISRKAKITSTSLHHIVHEVEATQYDHEFSSVRYIRLTIRKPATKWGVSIWRFQVWGFEA